MVVTNFNPVNDFIIAAGFIVTVVVLSRNKIPRQNVADLQALVETQGKTIEELKQGRLEDRELIGKLQGQVDTYKELPLRELADGIKKVVELSQDNANSNKDILKTLQATAKINAEDRDVLTSQHKGNK